MTLCCLVLIDGEVINCEYAVIGSYGHYSFVIVYDYIVSNGHQRRSGFRNKCNANKKTNKMLFSKFVV